MMVDFQKLEYGRIFGQFCGYFREGLDFTNERGERQFYGRYDYLGNTILLPCQTETEYAQLPEPGTLIRAVSHIIPSTKTGSLKSNIIQMQVAGRDKDFQNPTPDELYAGYLFYGNIFVTEKIEDVSRRTQELYRQVIVALFGGSYKFSLTDDLELYSAFENNGIHSISGTVDTVIIPAQRDNRWVQECVTTLNLAQVQPFKTNPAQPKQPAKPSA